MPASITGNGIGARGPRRPGLDAEQRALWNWVNVQNLDSYLQEVYAYYVGKGIYTIALTRGLNLLTVGFVISFSTFLLACLDYSSIHDHTQLSNVIIPQCVSRFSGWTFLFFAGFGAFYIWQCVSYVYGIIRLIDMYRFYTHLLGIPDADIQTISWPTVVSRISKIRESNALTAAALSSSMAGSKMEQKLDAHDIANRIMRQENYLIALFNKELLDLSLPLSLLPLPSFINVKTSPGGGTLTRALEWNLRFCVMEFFCDPYGRPRQVFLKERNSKVLIEGLKRRFIFMGFINAIFAPFIVLYLLMYSFFRYFEEYHKNPSSIGGRQYTPLAQWKFREFNELPHLFTRRMHQSYPFATEYISQFPSSKIAAIMHFVSFVAGAFAAVLLLATVINPDVFLGFEITPHRSVLFYLGLFGSILAVSRGMVPDERTVFDPELVMRDVVAFTHYMPTEWRDQLHSKTIHAEFGKLYEMKIMIFAQELLSVLLTPFILWFSLPACAPKIIDFFREFTVHVDGLGYVCSFAVFDFKRHGNINYGAPTTQGDERYMSKEGKMEKSFLNFKAAHPEWIPTDPAGSLYLSRMAEINAQTNSPVAHATPSAFRRSKSRGRIPPLPQAIPSMHLPPPAHPPPTNIAERAQLYDRALQKSMNRRRKPLPRASGSPSTVAEDVEGEEAPSELGDSYVREVRPAGGVEASTVDDGMAVDELADGGVMGLLADIYDRRRAVL
ncbi:APG9-domain-containing protein [Calocera viscosa TUFC12733]|uniref:Autophagy-related protein 9 n=1 Tax=Calocera viscosa (strain TUFC12733) TaxID=1330018 RepID=A0A167NK20_CALVF|nr:APG9-domain-containing protein [Calocera viscosa TUFC12733]